MNNLPKVVTQQRRGWASNPRLLDRKSDALPLSHRATPRLKVGINDYISSTSTVVDIAIIMAEFLLRASGYFE